MFLPRPATSSGDRVSVSGLQEPTPSHARRRTR
ncbi:hypothetical protein QFZ75_007149 [Streptomyces sp. V3I8]|nr:hypothetical protein [Streptomyces sp. V3I8]